MRWIKTSLEHTYEKLTDDIVTFSLDLDSVCGVHCVTMTDTKGNVTYLSDQFAEEEVALAVLDELMVFITEEDDAIIDMDVVFELAMDRR